jgi:serine/threonine-protein kinase
MGTMQPVTGTWAGRVIDGRYQVEALLGQGGMGVVLRARHRYTGQLVAVKLLHAHLLTNADLAARFLAEARAPAAIGHPGIVSVIDAGRSPEGELYLVMELLGGQSLAARLRAGPLGFDDIRRTLYEILAALHAAHGAGFIHRDLKPDNVFLAQPGATVKLLDFGIAKVLAEGVGGGQTASGVVMGTVAYMSPEQLRDSSNVDARTDLWAAGVILYEMLAGRLPFVGDTIGSLVASIMTQPPRPLGDALAEFPRELDTLVRRALAPDVHQRFTSAAEMATWLQAVPPFALARRGALPGAYVVAPGVMAASPPIGASGAVVPPGPSVAPSPFGPGPASAAPPGLASAAPPGSASAPPPGPGLPMTVPPATPSSSPGAAFAPAAPKSRAMLWVAIAALLVAAGFGVALVLVVRGSDGAAAALAEAEADAGEESPGPTPVLPEPAAVSDAAPPVRQPDLKAPAKPAGKREVCTAACQTSTKKCGIVFAAGQDCMSACLSSSDDGIECLADAEDCDELAVCSIDETCDDEPAGRASCQETVACMIQCGDANPSCYCRCFSAMAPRYAGETVRFFSCVIGKCQAQCGRDLTACAQCAQSRCAAAVAACQ